MTAALNFADQNIETHLVEKKAVLGGFARNIYTTLEGGNVQEFINGMIDRIKKHPNIHLYTEDHRLAALKTYLRLGFVPWIETDEAQAQWRAVCGRLRWPFTPGSWRSTCGIDAQVNGCSQRTGKRTSGLRQRTSKRTNGLQTRLSGLDDWDRGVRRSRSTR